MAHIGFCIAILARISPEMGKVHKEKTQGLSIMHKAREEEFTLRKNDEERTSWLFKHYMTERDFEVEHAVDNNYHDIEPHYHEFYEMFFFISGHVDYIVNDELFHLRQGDLLIIPPNVLHNPIFLDFKIPYERYVVWISANALGRLIRQDADCGYFLRDGVRGTYLLRSDEAARGALRGSFVTLYHSYRDRELCYRSEGLSVIMRILTDYNRALAAQSGRIQRGSRSSLLSNVLRYVQSNLTGDLSLDAVAAAFFCNKYSISHIFKQSMNISYYQYVIQMRLIAGKNNILAGVPVGKVWETCGFSDHAGFYRAFRKWYGVSPSEFRELHAARIGLSE